MKWIAPAVIIVLIVFPSVIEVLGRRMPWPSLRPPLWQRILIILVTGIVGYLVYLWVTNLEVGP